MHFVSLCYFHISGAGEGVALTSRHGSSLKERSSQRRRSVTRPPVSAGHPEFSRITSAKGKISPEYSASENVHYSFDGGEDRGGEKFLTLESIVRRDD